MKTENRCGSCKHWQVGRPGDPSLIEAPIDPDTYEPMAMPFGVRQCKSPLLLRFERPTEPTGASVMDGSTYCAILYTAEHFGCVNYDPQAEKPATFNPDAAFQAHRFV